MKNLASTMSVLVSISVVASSAMATNSGQGRAVTPSPASVRAVEKFVGDYSDPSMVQAGGVARVRTTDLMLYPTADRDILFVSFHTDRADLRDDHIALVRTRDGRVTRFTDFTGAQPKTVTAASRDDAQSQARALLVSANRASAITATTQAAASGDEESSAQAQAASLLRAASTASPSHGSHLLIATRTPAAYGDSQAMARGLLTSSNGE